MKGKMCRAQTKCVAKEILLWHGYTSAQMAAPAWYKVSALACASELLGTIWFAFFGGIVQGATAPVVNGLALIVCIYSVVHVSGGHLNPGSSPLHSLVGSDALKASSFKAMTRRPWYFRKIM